MSDKCQCWKGVLIGRQFDLKLFHVSSQETNVLACLNSDDKRIYVTEVIVHCWYFS